VRMSLGGVRDEAEIRGHRRTYIGALPGQIIQMMKKAGTKNPVIMLDEIDKMSMDFRGDPSAAMLEVLDPAQNTSFQDHYLDVEYDLSNVLFIATANVLHTIPAPLQDRMEVIRLSGYTELEKLEIAKRFLVPKQLEGNGLKTEQLEFEDAGLGALIHGYTRESGVRNLEREVGNVCRKVVRSVVMSMPTEEVQEDVKPKKAKGRKKAELVEVAAAPLVTETQPAEFKKVTITDSNITEFLGPEKFRDSVWDKKNEIGSTTGLAWTEVGGTILTTEVSILEGRGKLTTTGKLGDVMQESAQAAMSYVRSRSHELGLPRDFYRHIDIHVHVPEGAIPKDGPSAGITLATSISSALAKIPVRGDIAMTGEITLRGKVLAIGGLKEKLLAAHRYGITEAILPKENEKDLADIPDVVKRDMKLHFVSHMDEVLKLALESEPVPVPPSAMDFTTKPVEDLRH
jgi:ATP-dependent Lon protease